MLGILEPPALVPYLPFPAPPPEPFIVHKVSSHVHLGLLSTQPSEPILQVRRWAQRGLQNAQVQ